MYFLYYAVLVQRTATRGEIKISPNYAQNQHGWIHVPLEMFDTVELKLVQQRDIANDRVVAARRKSIVLSNYVNEFRGKRKPLSKTPAASGGKQRIIGSIE